MVDLGSFNKKKLGMDTASETSGGQFERRTQYRDDLEWLRQELRHQEREGTAAGDKRGEQRSEVSLVCRIVIYLHLTLCFEAH